MKIRTVAIAVVLLAAAAAHAAEESETETQTVSVAGVDVEVDRRGRIAALDEGQRARLLANLRAQYAARGVSQYDGVVRRAPDGSESMALGLDHERITVARIAADGKLETTCVRGAEAAAQALVSGEPD